MPRTERLASVDQTPSTQDVASTMLEDLDNSRTLSKIIYGFAISFFAISLFTTFISYQNSYQPLLEIGSVLLLLSTILLYAARENFSHFANFEIIRYNIMETKNFIS